MNTYGKRAQQAWQQLAPSAYAQIPDPNQHFSMLGREAQDQIAEHGNVSPATVRRRISEGIDQLRDTLLDAPPATISANLAAAAAALASEPTRPPAPAAASIEPPRQAVQHDARTPRSGR